jgi:hypothetical protein
VLQWEEKTGSTTDFLVNSLFGTTTQIIIDSVWETVYICRFEHPVNTTRKLILLITPNSQYEIGFKYWLGKMALFSKQAGAPLLVCSTPETKLAIQLELKRMRITVGITYQLFGDMEDFAPIAKNISGDDLVIIVSARKGTLSFQSYMDTLPGRILKNFPFNNFILLYPEQTRMEFLESGLQSDDLSLSPIQEQIDNLNKLGKAVKKIFNPGNTRSTGTGSEEVN